MSHDDLTRFFAFYEIFSTTTSRKIRQLSFELRSHFLRLKNFSCFFSWNQSGKQPKRMKPIWFHEFFRLKYFYNFPCQVKVFTIFFYWKCWDWLKFFSMFFAKLFYFWQCCSQSFLRIINLHFGCFCNFLVFLKNLNKSHLALPHSTKNFAAFYFFVNISSKCLTQGMEDHQITGIKDKT